MEKIKNMNENILQVLHTFKLVLIETLAVCFPFIAIYISFLDNVKSWLQIITLFVGIIVGVFKALLLIKKYFSSDKNQTKGKDEELDE